MVTLTEEIIKTKIGNLLTSTYDIDGSLKGFFPLIDAIYIHTQSAEHLPTSELYTQLGTMHKVSQTNVERNIRHCIFLSTHEKITNSKFIAKMACIIKDNLQVEKLK